MIAQNSEKIEPRHCKQALQQLDTLNGISFFNPWDYQMHSEGFGKPGDNALPYVVKQAYRSFRLFAVPEPFQLGGIPRYSPTLPDGTWGVFTENGKNKGVVFNVKNEQLHGLCIAHFSGALVRFLIPPFYYNKGEVQHSATYTISGKFMEGKKVGKWELTDEKGKTILEWSYNNAGKFQSDSEIFRTKFFRGLIRYQYVSEDYQSIIQGFAKEMYTVYKNTPKGKLIRQGDYLKFHSNGFLAAYGQYDKGQKEGEWIFWDMGGEEIRKEYWIRGRLENSQSK